MKGLVLVNAYLGIKAEDFREHYQELISVVGIDRFIAICDLFGGTPIYIPKSEIALQNYKSRMIKSEFNGGNILELAKKYNLSQRTIYRILEK